MKRSKEIGTLLVAMMLVSMALMPAVSAEDSTWKLPPFEFNDSYENVIIDAEVSPMMGDNLHSIPIGSIIHHSSDGITTVFTSNGKHYLSAIDAEAKMVSTPSGFRQATHVHQIPSGSEVSTRGNVTRVYYNGTNILTVVNQEKVSTIPKLDGWIESSSDWSVDELWMFSAYWNVPSDPPSPQSDVVNFFFNAIEPSTAGAILQPVLEWNNAGSGRWTGAAWYGVGSDYFHSQRIDVSTSDKIKGLMNWDDLYNRWYIRFMDITTGQQTSIYSSDVGTSSLAVFAAFEGYNLEDDTDVPGDTTFYSMDFRDSNYNIVDITWDPWINPTAPDYLTGLNVEVFSDAQVKLHTAN